MAQTTPPSGVGRVELREVAVSQAIPDVSDLTLEEKVGQMLCLGWSAPDCLLNVNAQARECVREIKAGGMVVMGRNISPPVRPLPPIDASAVRARGGERDRLLQIALIQPGIQSRQRARLLP